MAERDGRRYRTLSVRAMHGTAIDMDDRPFGIIKGRGIVFGDGDQDLLAHGSIVTREDRPHARSMDA